MPFAQISGIGSYLPEARLTNADLERMVDTSDEWITTRTGIRERRVIAEGETTSDLAARAGLAAIADAGLAKEDVDMLVVATCTPDRVMPSTACITQAKMGLKCAAFDVMAACTGFIFALQVGTDAIEAGRARNVVVIGAEAMTRLTDFTDRSTCVLFGDGAGAMVLSAGDEPGMRCFKLGSDGTGASLLTAGYVAERQPGTDEAGEGDPYIKMAGNDVFKFAARIVPQVVNDVLDECGMTIADVRWLVPHQANERITMNVTERLGMPAERVCNSIAFMGNTSGATIPIAMDGLYTGGGLTVGDEIVVVGFGAGLTWGASAIRWTKEAR